MTPGIALCLVFHNHQPVGNFGWVFRDLWDHAYEPLLGALEERPGFRAGLHYSGPLLDWMEAEEPSSIARIRALVERDQVEVLGSGLTEPILISLPSRDRQVQLVRMGDRVEQLFGQRPRGAWLTERVWEPELASDLARAGYAWTIVDDNHLRAANVPRVGQWGTWSTDDQGLRLTLFPSEQGLRYAMPWVTVEETIAYLRENATADRSRIGLMGDDGEKFGGWPGTHELCWGEGAWMGRFLDAVEENADWIDTVRPSDWYDAHPPQGRVYVPTTSYLEMTEWALPPDEFAAFHTLLAEAKETNSPAQRFLFGGFWRAFAARYREINDLHKQMLRTSEAVDAMDAGPERERALGHLLRGQSNDVYWHGLFGGIYLVHLRLAVAAELIGAYDLACGGAPETQVADLDLDGVDEVQLGADGHLVTIDVAEGGGIGSWDLFASRLAAGSGMRRRPEAYHEILRRHFETLAAEAVVPEEEVADDDAAPVSVSERVVEASAAAMTTEEQVVLLHEGIEDLLVYDDHERRGALVAFHDLGEARDAGPAKLGVLDLADLGDFTDGAHELVVLDAGVSTLRRLGTVAGRPLELTKRIRLGGDRRTPELAIELDLVNPEPIARAFEVDLSFAWNMAGGGHNPQAYYAWTAGGVERSSFHDEPGDLFGGVGVEFGNRDVGVRITAELDHPGRITWYPIETVSKSEGGYERVYQHSNLHCRWPVVLAPGATARVGVTFRAEQSRDLRDEETPGESEAVVTAAGAEAAADAEAAVESEPAPSRRASRRSAKPEESETSS